MISRQENPCSNSSKTGAVRPKIQAIDASNARRRRDRQRQPEPPRQSRRPSGNRPTRIAIKTRLSMPSTISSAVSASRLAQRCWVGQPVHRKHRFEYCRSGDRGQTAVRGPRTSQSPLCRTVSGNFQPSSSSPGSADASPRRRRASVRRATAPRTSRCPWRRDRSHFFDDVAVAGLFEIGLDDGSGISLGRLAVGDAKPAAAHNPNSLLRRAVTRNCRS